MYTLTIGSSVSVSDHVEIGKGKNGCRFLQVVPSNLVLECHDYCLAFQNNKSNQLQVSNSHIHCCSISIHLCFAVSYAQKIRRFQINQFIHGNYKCYAVVQQHPHLPGAYLQSYSTTNLLF